MTDGPRWWVRGLLAVPEYPHGDGEQRDWLGQQVQAALAVEVGGMAAADILLFRSRFGQGRLDGALELRTAASTPAAGLLGSVAGVSPWRELAAAPNLAGQTEYVPARLAPAGLAFGARSRWQPSEDFWTRSAEELVHVAGITDVVALIGRLAGVTPAATVAAERRWQRMRAVGRATEPDGAKTEPVPCPDAYSARLFIGGDPAGVRTLRQLWLAATGTDLTGADAFPPMVAARPGSLEAQIQLLLYGAVTAEQAVRLLPVPLLDAHSGIGAERHVYRSHQHASAASATRDILIGVTDAGTTAGMAADTVNQHILVLGDTGFGKSTTVMGFLHQAWTRFRISFLVIDPVKEDFARLRVTPPGGGSERPVRHLSLGTVAVNPLVVPRGVSPAVFAGVMSEAFNATSDLGESYPLGAAVAQAAFDRLYQQTTTPTFADLMAAFMTETHRGDMSGENGRNVRASVGARLRAITGGAAGDAFAGGPEAGIDWDRLADEPTVITFARALPGPTLATLYAFLIAAHSAWRQANPTDGRHLVVLEEAGMVFGPGDQPADRMLTRLLATMRATGQGYLAISQRPDQLSDLAAGLFPNVISHRMLHTQDLGLLGVLGASAEDLSSLGVGEAVIRVGTQTARGSRVRALTVPDRSYRPGAPGRPANQRAGELVTLGDLRRPWCDQCPQPCTGSTWLRFTPQATAAARRATGLSQQAVNAMGGAMRAAQAEQAPRGTGPQFYCVAAAAVTALNSRTPADAARATTAVRAVVDRAVADARSRTRLPDRPRKRPAPLGNRKRGNIELGLGANPPH